MGRHSHGETVVRVRAAEVLDPFSNEVTGLDWDDTSELAIGGCAVDDSKTRETIDANRSAVVTDFVVWPDSQYDITAQDRLVVRGLTCEIVGRPSTPTNPFTGDKPGMELFANVWEG